MSTQSTAGARPNSTRSPIAPATTALSMRGLAAMLLLAVMWGLSIPVTKLGLLTLPR